MEQSRLFKDVRVRQTQGVTYLHHWVNTTVDEGGFYFYPNGTEGGAEVIPPEFNTALILDGSVIVHGVDVFRPWQRPPKINSTSKTDLRYIGNDKWLVVSNNETVEEYDTTDLRISLVWR
jgi:hypothetical protein